MYFRIRLNLSPSELSPSAHSLRQVAQARTSPYITLNLHHDKRYLLAIMASEPLKQESPKPQRQSIRQRFSQRRSSIATDAILMFSNFRHNLKDFIWHSGKYSVVAAVVPVLGVLMSRNYGKETTDVFFGSMSTEVPPILNNVTVVPYSPAFTKKVRLRFRSATSEASSLLFLTLFTTECARAQSTIARRVFRLRLSCFRRRFGAVQCFPSGFAP